MSAPTLSPEALAARFESPVRQLRTTAWLGAALGMTFTVCFLTGVWSHLAQHPPSWFAYPARPAGLYRITQGVHVTTGMASIPLLLAKLWAVYPRFVEWPPVRSGLHAVERLALLPLVGGSLFMLFSGVANVARWYPWTFNFPRAHFWAAWITIGALVIHIGAKATTTARVLRSGADEPAGEPGGDAARERRTFVAGVAGAAGAVVLATAGGTISALGSISVLAQRRPGQGPQGLPVNKSASQANVSETALDPGYRLVVDGEVRTPLSLSVADLRAMPVREATLPIACVEGWSASARWRGVALRDVLARAGAAEGAEVTVVSLQTGGSYGTSEVNHRQAADADTLLALDINGEPLHLDHGFPVRLIGPNRPGVAQTKWVSRLEVH